MRIGEIAGLLGVSDNTIRNWIVLFPALFSQGAQGKAGLQRNFTDEDVILLATIAQLRNEGREFSEIQERIGKGERVQDFLESNPSMGARLVPAEVVGQVVDATEIRIELERTKSDLAQALHLLETERAAAKETEDTLRNEIKAIQQEIRKLERELGEALGELNYRRKQDDHG